MESVLQSALKEGLMPAIIVAVYLVIIKIIDSKKEKNQIKITNDLVKAINKISIFLDSVTDNIIDKDKDKCKTAIKTAFFSLGMNLIDFVSKTIINNNIDNNKDNIISTLKHLINSEYYNVYNSLSMYNINGIKVNDVLKEEWLNELEKDVISIIYSKKLTNDNKILTFNNRISIRCQDYSVYVTNKVFK